MASADALAHDRGAGARAHVHHLRTGISLLVVVGEGHGIELADRISPLQHTAGVFPGDRRTCFYLGPTDLAAIAAAVAPLSHKVVDPADAMLIPGIPVLHGGILDRGVIEDHQLNDGRVQLVGIKHRRRATLQITHGSPLFRHDQGALKLAGVTRVDAEIGGKLHRALNPLRDEHKRTIAENRRIEGRIIVIVAGNNRTEITLDQLRVLLDSLTN